jgi:hypothetical protein
MPVAFSLVCPFFNLDKLRAWRVRDDHEDFFLLTRHMVCLVQLYIFENLILVVSSGKTVVS